MAAFNPIIDLFKKLRAEEAKHLEALNHEFEQTYDFIDTAYINAVKLFTSGKPITYPKTPSTVRTSKRRTGLLQGNKENKKNKPNTEDDEEESKKRLTTVKTIKNEAPIPEMEEPDAPVRRTRRYTRIQAAHQADASPDEVFAPQTVTKLKKSTKQSTTVQPKFEVLKKVKEYEEKIISPLKNATPEREQRASMDKMFVSTLSPIKLVDRKLTASPYVLCTPIEHKPEFSGPTKTIRRSPSLGKRRVSGMRKSVLNAHLKNGHGRPSSHRSSVRVAKLHSEAARLVEKEGDNCEVGPESDGDEVVAPMEETQTDKDESSYQDTGSEDEDDVIPKTPTPPRKKRNLKCTSNARSTQKVRSGSQTSEYSGSRQVVPSSASKRFVGTPVSVSRPKMNASGRYVSPKVLEAKMIRQKQEALEKKEEKCRLTLKSRFERQKRKAEEIKRMRALKMQEVLDKRNRQEEERKLEHLVKIAAKDKPRERSRLTPSKACTRLQEKAFKAEERRSKEEEIRKIKLQEKEEEQIRYLEQSKKKKEMELLKQQERLAEQRKIQLAKQEMKELEENRRVELEKQRLEEEEERKRKELELQRLKELQRQAAEIEKQRERERLAREKAEMERLREREKLAREKVQQAAEAKKENVLVKSVLNSTFTQLKPPNPDSYDMTPEVIKQPIELKDPDNYDIDDLNSEDSTDDECNPRKHIPKWAQHQRVKIAVMRQMKDVNFESFFSTIDPPELEDIFNKACPRYCKRGSSANWTLPYEADVSFSTES